jgi:hypothetical protein
MPFSDADRVVLLAVRGVGPKVVARIEDLGIADLPTLARQDADGLCSAIAAALGTTCWRNSPMARGAVADAIAAARASLGQAEAGGRRGLA